MESFLFGKLHFISVTMSYLEGGLILVGAVEDVVLVAQGRPLASRLRKIRHPLRSCLRRRRHLPRLGSAN